MSDVLLFFFFKQKTAYELRISDWSSDVCSSDLAAEVLKAGENPGGGIKTLAFAGVIGSLIKLAAASGLRLIPDAAIGSTFFGRYFAFMGTNLSPALLGVGYIVGDRKSTRLNSRH